MKNIINFIKEGFNSPDVIYIKNKSQSVNWSVDAAYPFFYNTRNDEVTIAKHDKVSHFNYVKELIKDDYDVIDLFDLENNDIEDKKDVDEITDAIYNNGTILQGRIWIMPTKQLLQYVEDDIDESRNSDDIHISKDLKDEHTLFISWWPILDDKDVKNCNETVIDKLNEVHYNKKLNISEYYYIDGNGDWEIIKYKSNSKISTANVQTEEEKLLRLGLKAIHLASQREKKIFFAGYNKSRTEHFQREYYNKTKSKTAAEWHHTKTKRYNPVTGKMEWGEKIGDSLQIRPLLNIINETLNKSYDLQKFISKVKEKFDVDCSSYLPWESGRCMVGFKTFDKNDKTLNQLMNLFNVFISEISEEDITLVYFEQAYGKEVTTDVYKYDKIYHLTKEKFVNKILKNGLQPRKSIGGYKKKACHPDRVYLLSSEVDKRMIRKYANQLITTELLVIDLKKLKDEYNTTLKFYKDPQSEETFSIYTDSVIRPEVITKTTIDEEFK